MADSKKKFTPAAELRVEDSSALETRLREAKQELFNLRFQNATGQLENTARLRKVRKDIARIYTVMSERELGIVEFDNDESDGAPSDGAQSDETQSADSVKAEAS